MRSWKTEVILLLSMTATAPPVREVAPTEWPLERIVKNLEERIAAAPNDGEAHYNLGRAYAFAFALKRSTLWTRDDWIDDLDKQDRKSPKRRDPTLRLPPPSEDERLVQLAQGMKHLLRACELAPKEAPFRLTLAWLLETGSPLGDRVDANAVFALRSSEVQADERASIERWISDLTSNDAAVAKVAQTNLCDHEHLEHAVALLSSKTVGTTPRPGVTEIVQRYWTERAIDEYWHTIELAYPQETAGGSLSLRLGSNLHSLVSYEALLGYRHLVEQRGVHGAEEERRHAEVAAKQEELEKMPIGSTWVTPLVVSLEGCRTLDELVTEQLQVPFDLDGEGHDELWPWIAPDAGWLVWDPNDRGEITSGQQLFGSASAWLFFSDGYRVLDALDDDRDGELRGRELAGIGVWFDRDTDGVSDRGEVVSVEDLGVVALSTKSTLTLGRSPANLCGAELADGRVLPTYDWVLEPVATP